MANIFEVKFFRGIRSTKNIINIFRTLEPYPQSIPSMRELRTKFPFSGIAHRSSDKNDLSIAIIMDISDFEKLDVPLTSNFNKRREPLAD